MKIVAAAGQKKRGSYLFFTPEEKARVAQYGSINGVQAAVRRFSGEFSKELKKNTVQDCVKVNQKELQKKQKSAEIGCDRGRLFLLRERIDAEVQTIIRAMHDSGAVVNTSIAIAWE